MSSFSLYQPMLLQVEGGFQKMPNDNGNYNSLGQLIGTNFGISARWYESILGRPTTLTDILNLTKNKATQLYEQYFWNAMRAGEINNQSLANTYADHGINAGPGRAVKMIQYLLINEYGKNIALDGAIGPQTLGAINSVNAAALTNDFNDLRKQYYNYLGNNLSQVMSRYKSFFQNELKIKATASQSSFVKGWINRIATFAIENTGSSIGVVTVLIGLGIFFAVKYTN